MGLRIRLRKFLFIPVAVAFVIFAVFFLFFPRWSQKAPARLLTTTVTVHEGIVDVYRIIRGKKDYRGPFRAGEVAVVQTEVPGGADTKALGILEAAVPIATAFLQKEADSVAGRMVRGQYAGHLTAETINRSLAEHMTGPIMSQPQCDITESGFTGSAVFGRGFFKTRVYGEGQLKPTENGRLYLTLTRLKVGPLQMPNWALRRLEDVFEAAMARTKLSIEVLEIEYEKDGVLVYARRRP